MMPRSSACPEGIPFSIRCSAASSPRRSSALVDISPLSHLVRRSRNSAVSYSAHSRFRVGKLRRSSFCKFSSEITGISTTTNRLTSASFSSRVPA